MDLYNILRYILLRVFIVRTYRIIILWHIIMLPLFLIIIYNIFTFYYMLLLCIVCFFHVHKSYILTLCYPTSSCKLIRNQYLFILLLLFTRVNLLYSYGFYYTCIYSYMYISLYMNASVVFIYIRNIYLVWLLLSNKCAMFVEKNHMRYYFFLQ